MDTVVSYLRKERQEVLLDYGFDLASTLRDAAPDASFEKKMYNYWVQYYETLREVTDEIVGPKEHVGPPSWDRTCFRKAMKDERDALKETVDAIKVLIDEEDGNRQLVRSRAVRRQLRVQRQLLRIERFTNRRLRKEASSNYT